MERVTHKDMPPSHRKITPDSLMLQNKIVLLTVVIGLVLSVFLFTTARNWEQQHLEAKLTTATKEYNRALTNKFNHFIHELELIKFFYFSSDNITFKDFRDFTKKLANDSPVQAVAWLPKIKYNDKSKHERMLKQQLNINYTIKEKALTNEYINVSKRAYYYPVAYINPMQTNMNMFGYDMGSEELSLAAIKLAYDTEKPAATSVVQLDAVNKDNSFVLVFYPVFDRDDTLLLVNKGHKSVQFFIVGVFNINNMIEKSLRSLNSKGLNIYFIDITENPNRKTPFYTHTSRSYKTQNNDIASMGWFREQFTRIFLEKIQKTNIFGFAGRTWLVKYNPISKFYVDNYHWYAVFVFILAVSFTMFTVYLVRIHHQKNQQQLKLNKVKSEQLEQIKIAQNTMLDTMAGGVIIINAKGIIESFNKSAEIMFGYSSEEVIGQTINSLMPEEISRHHDQYLFGVLKNDTKITSIDSRFKGNGLRKGGSVFPISLSIKSMNINGETKFTGILRDITLQVENEKEIIQAKENAELANRSKSDFLSNMSHELRTPMHAILSFSKFGINKYSKVEREKLKKYFEKINLSGTRLLRLLDSLLDLAKLEAGKVEFEFDYFDINSIVLSVVHEFEALVSDCQVVIKVKFTSDERLIECDSEKIEQVMRNLIGNALKFTPKGHSISVYVNKCQMQNQNDKKTIDAVQIKIIDEGIGIPNDELDLVFDKFAQSSKTNDGSGGTGLGLAICAEIISKHHGRIWAENNSDVGATFFVEIPAEQRKYCNKES